jgi:DMSO/TMAO reductase YedYZ molybdopterin-dependent catalytic subunit
MMNVLSGGGGKRLAGAICAAMAAISSLVLAAGLSGMPDALASESDSGDSEESSSQEATPFSSMNTIGYPTDGGYRSNVSELPDLIHNKESNAQNAIDNAPSRHIDSNGFTIQAVPADPDGYNITYLNADKRGCNTCHTMEDVYLNLPTFHNIMFCGYPTEQNYGNCIMCHSGWDPTMTQIHAIHNFSETFKNLGGTCESCHYIGEDGSFQRWDFEKYYLYKGYTDVAADDEAAQITIDYDQDTLTPTDKMFYKTLKQYVISPTDWRTDDSYMDPEIYENWVFTVGGDVDNPFSMTLPEMVEKFGTKTVVLDQQCTVNGVGNGFIYQCEVTGIPIKDVIEYAQPKVGVNAITQHAEDYYEFAYSIPITHGEDEDALLVLQVNGETLPNSQGYPVAAWWPAMSAGDQVKCLTGFDLEILDEDQAKSGVTVGDHEDPAVGTCGAKPNSAVLNYPTGVVLHYDEGQPVNLEGFADAYDEPIENVQFSLDGGETWLQMDTPDNDAERWTYWRMSFIPPEAGTYLLTIRATSIEPDGSERTCAWDTQFMFTLDPDFDGYEGEEE